MPYIQVCPSNEVAESKATDGVEKQTFLQDWATAIREDDLEKAEQLLRKIENPSSLVNGQCVAESVSVCLPQRKSKLETILAKDVGQNTWWMMVARCAAVSLVPLFLKYNVNVLSQNRDGNNFVHILVSMVILNKSKEKKYIETYETLVKNLKYSVLKVLLVQDNKQGLRPMEMAAFHQEWTMFLSLFSTRNVYVREDDIVYASVKNHEMTEYEEYPRLFKSPLLYFHRMSLDSVKFLTHNEPTARILRDWCKIHLKSLNQFVAFTFTLQVLYLVFLSSFDNFVAASSDVMTYNNHLFANHTFDIPTCLMRSKSSLVHSLRNRILNWSVLVFLFVGWIFQVICCVCVWISAMVTQVKLQRQKKYQMHVKSQPETIGAFPYILLFSLYIVLITVLLVLDILIHFGLNTVPTILQDIVYYCTVMVSLIMLLSYSMYLDSFGYFYLIIKGMIQNLSFFIFLYVLVCIPFLSTNERIVLRGKEVCDADFSPSVELAYNMAKTLLGSEIPHAPGVTLHSNEHNVIRMTHINYIFLVDLVLVNFLIALFTFSASECFETRQIRLQMVRLQVQF